MRLIREHFNEILLSLGDIDTKLSDAENNGKKLKAITHRHPGSETS